MTKVPDDWGSGNAEVFALGLWMGESSQSPLPSPCRWGLEELALPYQRHKEPLEQPGWCRAHRPCGSLTSGRSLHCQGYNAKAKVI